MPTALLAPVAAMRRLAERSLLLARQPMVEHVVMGSQTEADGRRLMDGHFEPPASMHCSAWSKRDVAASGGVVCMHLGAPVHAAQQVLSVRHKKHMRRVEHIIHRRARCTALVLGGAQDIPTDLLKAWLASRRTW